MARMLDGLNRVGLTLPGNIPEQWVTDCRRVGRGEPALEYLSRYLYRGVIAERDIIANRNGRVTFRYVESSTGQTRTRTLAGTDFLWLILQHVHPRAFDGCATMAFSTAMPKSCSGWYCAFHAIRPPVPRLFGR